jgi:hypothetical protein
LCIKCQAGEEPFHVRLIERANLCSDLQHYTHQNLKAAAEVLHSEVEEEQSPGQSLVGEIVELLLLPQPCTAGNIGRMLHSRHKLRRGLGQLHHSIGRIEQRNQLQLLDFLHRVLKEW